MMANTMWWEHLALRVGPTRNAGGPMSEYRGMVWHIAQGSYEGTIAWQRNPDSQTSSHFIVSKMGSIAQMVPLNRAAWTQADGNGRWLSVEFAGYSGAALTPAQLTAAAKLYAAAHKQFAIPLRLANTPRGTGLGWHGMGGNAWGGHPNCPGAPIIAQRATAIAMAVKLITPAAYRPPPAYWPPVTVATRPAWKATIAGIAEHYGHGTNWQLVWNDAKNRGLRTGRGRPEHIQPGDQVYVPRKRKAAK